jgi:hypothetical protein
MRAQYGIVWLSARLWAAALSSYARASDQARPLSIRRFETAPVIDGKLDEPAWREAAALRDFHQTQPGDNTTPSYPTTVLLGYDREKRRNERSDHAGQNLAWCYIGGEG